MLSEKKGSVIVLEIYRRMYKEATPSADIDEIIKSGEGKKENWFTKYYLPLSRQIEIIHEVCKENKITKITDKQNISTAVLLGASPESIRPKVLNKCPECGRFGGYANSRLLKIVKMKNGYVCEKCMLVFGEHI